MTDQDLVKTIRRVVQDEIGNALKPVIKTLDRHTTILDKHTEILNKHSETLDKHTEILAKHTKKLDALWDQTAELTEDMTEIKVSLKSHTVDIDHTKKRVTDIEDHLGI